MNRSSLVLAAALAWLMAGPVPAANIESGSTVFIEPMGGFETYLTAAFMKKRVPLHVTTNKDKAQYVISGTAASEKAGWAKVLVMRSAQSTEEASISIVDQKTGDVIYAYEVNKGSSARGKQSAAEACAKHVKEKIEKGE